MTDLVRSKLEKSLSVKSLDDLVRVETALDVWLLIDVSGSMKDAMRNGKAKITGLRSVVGEISQGRGVKMIAFGAQDADSEGGQNYTGPGTGGQAWVTNHIPEPRGGTPLDKAIRFSRELGASRTIVISDGQPNYPPSESLTAAQEFGGRIDVVYVGNPGDGGELFLRELAKSTGGTEFHGDLSEPKKLSSQIIGLLESADAEDKED